MARLSMALALAVVVAALHVRAAGAFNIGTRGATIHEITPRHDFGSSKHPTGSIAGGTLLTIKGSGFQRGGVAGRTDVFLGALRCDVIDYYSDDTKLVCRTREMHFGTSWAPIKVALVSMTSTSYAQCGGQAFGCQFLYHDGYDTPLIQRSSHVVTAGGKLRFAGYLRGRMAGQYKVTIDGEKLCEMHDVYTYHNSRGQVSEKSMSRRRRGTDTDQVKLGAPTALYQNTKCPYAHIDRLAKLSQLTVDACFEACARDRRCEFFSHGDGRDNTCMLCASKDNTEGESGYTFYAMPGDEPAGEDDYNIDTNERVVASTYNTYADDWCTLPPDLTAGRYNYTMHVAAGWVGAKDGEDTYMAGHGNARFSEKEDGRSRQAMAKPYGGSAYVLTVVPEVRGLSTQRSGLNGGQELVITGTGFHAGVGSCAENTVLLAGTPCAVTACTRNKLVCTVAGANATDPRTPYPSMSGLHYRQWSNSRDVYHSNNGAQHEDRARGWERMSNYNSPRVHDTTMGGAGHHGGWSRHEYRPTKMEWFREEERGHFVAPQTAKYRFWVLGDDVATVWINRNGTGFHAEDGMEMVAWNKGATSSFFSWRKHQISEFIDLEAGARYPFQIRFVEWGGHDYFAAGVEISDSDASTVLPQYARVNEIQRIKFRAPVVRQRQTIAVKNTAGTGKFRLLGQMVEGVRAQSGLIDIASNQRLAQLRAALVSTYGPDPDGGRGCTIYTVAEDDSVAEAGLLQFDITIGCNAAVVDGVAAPFKPVQVLDVGVEGTSFKMVGTKRWGTNMDFNEHVGTFATPTQAYKCEVPTGWSSSGTGCKNIMCRAHGTCPWTSENATLSRGSKFIYVTRYAGEHIYQTLDGLTAGTEYVVSFHGGMRYDSLTEARLAVSVDGVVLFDRPPQNKFTKYSVQFTAKGATATLRFENNAVDAATGGRTSRESCLWLDEVEVGLKQDNTLAASVGNGVTVEAPSTPVAGTFKISMGDRGTPANKHLDADMIRANLKAYLPSVGDCAVRVLQNYNLVEGGLVYHQIIYEVEFLTPKGTDQPLMVIDSADTAGTELAVNVEEFLESNPDARLHVPIPDDMLEIAPHTLNFTTVAVRVNGINAKCADKLGRACAFTYDTSVTPAVDTATAKTGMGMVVKAGDALVITGTNLRHEGGGVDVSFGDAACAVTSHSATRIECTVGHSAYGTYVPVVTVEGTGLATPPSADYGLVYQYAIDSVAPLTGGVRGGNVITITGTGFSLDKELNGVLVGGRECEVLTATHTEVTCVAPAAGEAPYLAKLTHADAALAGEALVAEVVVGYFDGKAHGDTFVYDWGETPSVVAMTPVQHSSARTAEVSLELKAGFAFSAAEVAGCAPSMTFVSNAGSVRECINLKVTAAAATCTLVRSKPLPASEQKTLFPRLQLCSGGAPVVAHPEPGFAVFDHALRIASTIPPVGSIAGGTLITIHGAGFVDSTEKILRSALTYNYYDPMTVVNITLPDRTLPCVVVASSFDRVECRTTMPMARAASYTKGQVHTYVGGYSGVVSLSVNDFKPAGCGNDPHAAVGVHHNYTSNGRWVDTDGNDLFGSNSTEPKGDVWGPAVKDGAWNWKKDGAWNWEADNEFVCEFDFAPIATPAIKSITPKVGSGAATLTITGSSFGNQPVVHLGVEACAVSYFNMTHIECRAPAMTAGRYTVRVDVPQLGYAAHPEHDPVEYVSKLVFSRVAPQVSSNAGGQLITVHGHGFSEGADANTVTVQGVKVHTIFANHSQIVAVTPKAVRTPAITGTPQACQADDMYVQVSYAGTDTCRDANCLEADTAPSSSDPLVSRTCNASDPSQMFRLEAVKRSHERDTAARWQTNLDPVGVFRLRSALNDSLCLQPAATRTGAQCVKYAWAACSASRDQEIHLSKFFGVDSSVYNWAFGGDDGALDSYYNRGCAANTVVWHCTDNVNTAKQWKLHITDQPTGKRTAACSTTPGDIAVTVEADPQPDVFFGQTTPSYHTSYTKNGLCGEFGGAHKLVYRQTLPFTMAKANWGSFNAEDPTADQYSILNQLASYRRIDGSFEFKMVWPEDTHSKAADGTPARNGTATNVWRQDTNPFEDMLVGGFEPIQLNYSTTGAGNTFDGLSKSSNAHVLMDGTEDDDWWYGVGFGTLNSGGYTGGEFNERKVELYVCEEGHKPVPATAAREYRVGWGFGTTRADASVTVQTGDTVTWVFELDTATTTHTIVSGTPGRPDGGFESGTLQRAGKFSHTFKTPGTYAYYSNPHGSITGSVRVRDHVTEHPSSYRLWSDKHCETPGACTMTYEQAITPTIEEVTPYQGKKGDRLTITGTRLTAAAGSGLPTEVKIGSVDCVVATATATKIECDLGETPAGLYDVFVTVAGRGTAEVTTVDRCMSWCASHTDADGAATAWDDRCGFATRACSGCSQCDAVTADLGRPGQFTSLLSVSSVSVKSGSLGGGTTLVLDGHGFGGGKKSGGGRRERRGFNGAWGGWFIYDTLEAAAADELGTKVRVCGQECTVIDSGYGSATCVTAPLQTANSLATYGNTEPVKLEPAQTISSDQPSASTDSYVSTEKAACAGSTLTRWEDDGTSSRYGYQSLEERLGFGLDHCKAMCDKHEDCTGFMERNVKGGRCSYWRRGFTYAYAHPDYTCHIKRGDVNARGLFNGNYKTLYHSRHVSNGDYETGQGSTCDKFTITQAECVAANEKLLPPGKVAGRALVVGSWAHVPPGCSTQSSGDFAPHFNSNANGKNDGSYTPLCARSGAVRACPRKGGVYEAHTEWNHGDVCRNGDGVWDCPAGCEYPAGKSAPYCVVSGTKSDVCRQKMALGKRCWVGMDLGEANKALVSRIRFFPSHQLAEATVGGHFEASDDMKDWARLGEVKAAHQGWNWINVDAPKQTPKRFIRYVGPAGGRCQMTQFEFYGHAAKASGVCPIEVASTMPLSHPSKGVMQTDHHESMVLDTKLTFEYKESGTGVVTSVEPKHGPSLGGELLTLSGVNLPVTAEAATVTINDRDCVVQTASQDGTKVTCLMTARQGLGGLKPPSLVVHNALPGQGNALSKPSVLYRDLDRWSQKNSWLNDEPPVEGDMVVIKEGQTILMDISPPQLFVLLVQGVLVFDRKDLNLDATYILVYGGTFEVGTEAEPFEHEATITLHGHRRKTIELPFVGSKVLGVADKGGFTSHGQGRGVDVPLSQKGVLDIHGKTRLRTWTKVAETVRAGTRTITTSEPTDFAPGEVVVLTAPHQELTVSRRVDALTFEVVEVIVANHTSEIRIYDGARGREEIDMRCEVALLSRNIVIQGAGRDRLDGSPTIPEGSYAYDINGGESSEAQLFGCHTGAFHGGHYRIENTEIRNCGQAGNLGRYSMHLHVTDDNPAPNTYLKANSIHHSFQRATTIHGTHHSLVRDNVAYHVMGHTYFVEDGDETHNTFDNNIGIFTRPSHLALKSDTGPATFWTAIPTNFWRNNIAVDSSDRGAWFELTNQGVTLEFFNNTFHDNNGIGWRNYPNYSPPSPQYFHNNTYFKNGGNGVFYKKGGDNHHVFSKFAENNVDIFWTKYKTHKESRLIPNVKDCVFFGEANANGGGAPAIFGPQHEYWYVDGATFVDYQDTGVLSGCAGCCSPVTFRQGAYTMRFENLVFDNSQKRTHWTCPYKQIMLDLDGSLTGYEGGTALPYYQFNEWDGHCEQDTAGNYSGGKMGMVCNDKVRVRRLQVWGNEPRELDFKKVFLKKSEAVPAASLASSGFKADRFGNKDKFGGLDWEQYHSTGLMFESCDDLDIKGLTGYCQDYLKADQNTGVEKHSNVSLDEATCLAWCKAHTDKVTYTGCEMIDAAESNVGCYRHTEPVGYASGTPRHKCWLFHYMQNDKTPLQFSGCTAMDGLDWINYRNSGTNNGEFDGWALPLITNHDYYADIDWHVDFQQLTMRWSEPFYFEEPECKPLKGEESVMIRWPYVDYRYRFRASYAGILGNEKPWYDSRSVTLVEGATRECGMTCLNGGRCVLKRPDCADKNAPHSVPSCECAAPANGVCFYGKTCNSKIACPSGTQTCIPFERTGRSSVKTAQVCGATPRPADDCTVAAVTPSRNVSRELSRADEFGAGLILREDDSLSTTGSRGEWKVALNPWVGVDHSNNSHDATRYQVLAEALQCGPSMCGLPGNNDKCAPDGAAWNEAVPGCEKLYWSERSTWVTLYEDFKITNGAQPSRSLPEEGHIIEIPANRYVVFDLETSPTLSKLVVAGRLEFGHRTLAAPKLALHADRVLVWGTLAVGTKAKPFTGQGDIVLHGVRTSPTLVATDQHFLGNKNMAIFGKLDMHGAPRTVRKTTLASTAGPGATTLTVDDAVVEAWAIGDRVMVTGTEYPKGIAFEEKGHRAYLEDYVPHQSEVRVIMGFEGAHTVVLNKPLVHRHFAGVIKAGNGKEVVLKAHVAIVNRNVRIIGDLKDTPTPIHSKNWYTGYGGHILVGEVNYGSEDDKGKENVGVTQKLGSVDLSDVEFDNMGKLASEHAALTFRYFSDLEPSAYPVNLITGCSFYENWNYVMVQAKSFGVVFDNNVVYRNFRAAIDVDPESVDAVITNNLIVDVHRSPDAYNPGCKYDRSCWAQPFAAVYVWNVKFAAVTGNVVSGSEDAGFTLYPVDDCGTPRDQMKVRDNEAYGTLVGLYLLPRKGECKQVVGFKAWKNAHLGVVTVDQLAKGLRLSELELADNHQGVSLNFVRPNGLDSWSAVEDSVILGSTAASTCQDSVVCRAVKPGDERGIGCGSEFGARWRRAGIVLPQYTNLAKTCGVDKVQAPKPGAKVTCRPPNTPFRQCSLPWENRFGNVEVQHATFAVTNTTFAHWNTDDCGKVSRAFALNPSQPDMAPTTTFTDIYWDAATVDPTARFQLGETKHQTHEATACHTKSCDAVNFFKIIDADGSTMNGFFDYTPEGASDKVQVDVAGERITLISSSNPAQARGDKCKSDASTGALVCRDFPLTRLILESNPPRFTKRRLGPAKITKYAHGTAEELLNDASKPGDKRTDNRTYFSVGPFPQGCSCQKHFAQFTFDVEHGHEYEIESSGVLQDENRISFVSEDPKMCVVAGVFFAKPMQIEVTSVATGDLILPNSDGAKPTLSDPAGTNLMNPQDRLLYITLCGGNDRQFWLNYGKKIQVTATIDMTVDEFFATSAPDQPTAGEVFVSNIALLLGIPSSQIKVACVHPVGMPCTNPLRRHRRVDANTTAAASASASGIEVDVEIAAPKATKDANGTETRMGFDESTQYLTGVADKLTELIEDNTIERELAAAGIPVKSMTTPVYEQRVTSTTTTTATATTTTTTTVAQAPAGKVVVVESTGAPALVPTTNKATAATTTQLAEAAAGSSESGFSPAVIGGAAAASIVVGLVIVLLVLRQQKKGEAKRRKSVQIETPMIDRKPSSSEVRRASHRSITARGPAPEYQQAPDYVYADDVAARGAAVEETPFYAEPNYFSGKRAEVQQDSLYDGNEASYLQVSKEEEGATAAVNPTYDQHDGKGGGVVVDDNYITVDDKPTL